MPRPWTVLPHSAIEKLQANLWTVEAALPQGPVRRRMGIAKLADGRLLFLNGIALDEPSMKELEAWGEPAFVVAANGFHRLDLGAYKVRYPKLRVLALPAAQKKVAEIVTVDGGLGLLPKEPHVEVGEVQGMKTGEIYARCVSGAEAALVFPGDVLGNMQPAPGFGGAIAKLAGFVGELRVPRLIKWIGLRDKAALRAQLIALADTPGLQRVFTCHGPVVSVDPAGALRRAAQGI